MSINRVKLWLIVLLSELNYRLLLHRRNFLCRWLSNHRWWGFDGLDGTFEVAICDGKSIKELDDWGQKFGNMFAGFLGMFFVVATIMFFFGCEISLKTEEAVEEDKVEEDSTGAEPSVATLNAADWIIFR